MRLEDTTPAEFLFGQLANNILRSSSEISHVPQGLAKKFNIIQPLTVIVDAVLVFLMLYSFNTSSTSYWYLILSLFMTRLFVQGYNGVLHLNKFGPDMRLTSNRLYFFSISQIIISHLFFITISSCLYLALMSVPVSTPLSLVELCLTIMTLMYIFLFADIQMVSLGMGTGIINQSSGIRSPLTNFVTLSKIKGKLSTQLAILTVLIWITSYYLVEHNFLIGLIPAFLIFVIYKTKWERVNASSIFMEIRGMILSAKPAILPSKILDTELEVQESPTSIIFPPNLRKSFKKPKTKKIEKTGRKSRIGNLQPLAIKSIKRIADSITLEENQSSSHMIDICHSCSNEILNTAKFCPFCGNRNS